MKCWFNNWDLVPICLSFPDGSADKESACNTETQANQVWSLELGRSPGEGNGSPLQYACLKNPKNRGAWWAAIHGVAKGQSQFTCKALLLPRYNWKFLRWEISFTFYGGVQTWCWLFVTSTFPWWLGNLEKNVTSVWGETFARLDLWTDMSQMLWIAVNASGS